MKHNQYPVPLQKHKRRPERELLELMRGFSSPFAAALEGKINPEEYLWLEARERALH